MLLPLRHRTTFPDQECYGHRLNPGSDRGRRFRLASEVDVAEMVDVGPMVVLLVILTTMPTFSSIAEASAHLSELVARVGAEHERVTVTVHGRPTAVILAVEALEETIAVLSDAASVRALAEADAELARREGEDLASVQPAMRARRASA